MSDKPIPEILARHVVAQSRLLRIEAVDLKFSNGVKRQFERLAGSGRGAVMIVPHIDEPTLIFNREHEPVLHNYQVGLPKGLIDPIATTDQAATREFKEEIGYGAT